jgi:hypothetical protein
MNLRQVDAEDRVQCGPRIEGRRIGRFVSMTSRRQPARGFGCSVSKTSQDNLDPQIALHDLGVVGVVKLQRLSESKDVLLTPVSGQRGSDLRLRGMTAPIAMVASTAGAASIWSRWLLSVEAERLSRARRSTS